MTLASSIFFNKLCNRLHKQVRKQVFVLKYVKEHPWHIIEEGYHAEDNRLYESLMSLGNGHMGHRGNFEEDFSGDSLQGSYAAGVYYPDKTRVGWWKNGYPEYFAKVLNGTNIIGIRVEIDGEVVDLGKTRPQNFSRVLDMKNGCLDRSFTYLVGDKSFDFKVKRFLSYDQVEVGAISYEITAKDDAQIRFTPYMNGDVHNEDANYDEFFWKNCNQSCDDTLGTITMTTKKTDFTVHTATRSQLIKDGQTITHKSFNSKDKYVEHVFESSVKAGETLTLYKYFSLVTDRDHDLSDLDTYGQKLLLEAFSTGFNELYQAHCSKWAEIWKEADIEIQGDVAAQQGIRFNIFHMKQTYNGEDPRLNIGPKGFTGEKYGGSTYWDTEAYCLPFYMATSHEEIPRNLLVYRHKHLDRAIENAAKLGLKGALYPMVTMNGEECHNEWEITFEEIHRNAAIAYAIFNYIRYTGESDYLVEYGLEVLLNISRFWADRVNYNPYKDCYMMLGVTGPNEYENNVNNNWYTNLMAAWTLEYSLEALEYVQGADEKRAQEILAKHNFSTDEFAEWKEIINKIYLPEIEELNVFAQQDGYMDKEQVLVSELDPSNLPLNQKWSWDKILRSCFIKQADVLQGIFFLSERYDLETKKRNFDFYEPRTVHESSLSPCVYSIIAGEIGYHKKAYELYQRSARLDLDNYNNDTDDGLHITSMAGTWMSVVYGFGGFSTADGVPKFNPFLPENWNGLSFHMLFRNRLLIVSMDKDNVTIKMASGEPLLIEVYGKQYDLSVNSSVLVPTDKSRAID